MPSGFTFKSLAEVKASGVRKIENRYDMPLRPRWPSDLMVTAQWLSEQSRPGHPPSFQRPCRRSLGWS